VKSDINNNKREGDPPNLTNLEFRNIFEPDLSMTNILDLSDRNVK